MPLLELINDSEKICKYIDIPFQHVSARILNSMRRGKSGSAVHATVERLRDSISGLILRTSLIVGFPGETEADFQALLDFVEQTRFDRLGVFKYSVEEGTAAASLTDRVEENEKERRWQEVMDLQASISHANNQALIGSIQRVMIDGVDDTGQLIGRTQGHAPEVDGVVYLENAATRSTMASRSGDFANVKITQALEYDLIGEVQNV
jgi:ribosomal protein S12 methylthiotransferase